MAGFEVATNGLLPCPPRVPRRDRPKRHEVQIRMEYRPLLLQLEVTLTCRTSSDQPLLENGADRRGKLVPLFFLGNTTGYGSRLKRSRVDLRGQDFDQLRRTLGLAH